jgi:hypothetical protein
MAERDAVEWLRMMAQFSILTDAKPHFTRIADELEALRAKVSRLDAHNAAHFPDVRVAA